MRQRYYRIHRVAISILYSITSETRLLPSGPIACPSGTFTKAAPQRTARLARKRIHPQPIHRDETEPKAFRRNDSFKEKIKKKKEARNVTPKGRPARSSKLSPAQAMGSGNRDLGDSSLRPPRYCCPRYFARAARWGPKHSPKRRTGKAPPFLSLTATFSLPPEKLLVLYGEGECRGLFCPH